MASEFFSGCVGGCSGVLAGHAFDTVKVRLQTQSSFNPLYTGTIDCFVKIIRNETILGLYKGISSPLYCLALINALIFGIQANVSRIMDNPNSYRSTAISGCLAGAVQSVICSPMELIKTHLQMQGIGEKRELFKLSKTHAYKNAFDCLSKIYKIRGYRGIYRGYSITLTRELPSFALYFTSFKWYCERFSETGKENDMKVWELLCAGGFAGTMSWILTYPIDVIKTRYQSDGMGVVKYKYMNITDCIKKSYKSEGMKLFTRGLLSTILRAYPTNAATFATVSVVNKWTKSLSSSSID